MTYQLNISHEAFAASTPAVLLDAATEAAIAADAPGWVMATGEAAPTAFWRFPNSGPSTKLEPCAGKPEWQLLASQMIVAGHPQITMGTLADAAVGDLVLIGYHSGHASGAKYWVPAKVMNIDANAIAVADDDSGDKIEAPAPAAEQDGGEADSMPAAMVGEPSAA